MAKSIEIQGKIVENLSVESVFVHRINDDGTVKEAVFFTLKDANKEIERSDGDKFIIFTPDYMQK